MLVFLWRLLSIFLLKVFLDVRGIIAWKWADFFARHVWAFSVRFGSLHHSFVAWRILIFWWYYSSKIYILVWRIFIIHWLHNFILSIQLNFNAKMFILPWPRHLLFWQWGFREDLMFSIVVRQVIAFCGRRKLKLWPRSCWRCRRMSGSSWPIRRSRLWLPSSPKCSSSLKNTILFCSASTTKALNCWGGTQWSMIWGLIWRTWTLSP